MLEKQQTERNRMNNGEFYAELDTDTNLYCVFHTEIDNKAFSSFASLEEAKADASERNNREWNDGGRLHDLN